MLERVTDQKTTDSTTPTEPVINIDHVSMQYPGTHAGDRVTALSDVSLTIAPGEFISLIGPSGCGKTTLLRLVADLLQPTSGKITINGKPAPVARRHRAYGFVPQAPTLYDWRTVLQNVELPLEIMNFPKKERRERAETLLAMVGLSEFTRKYPWQLSGGMQQRVSIARALSFKPAILADGRAVRRAR